MAQAVKKAKLKYSDGREQGLTLFKVEPKVYHWLMDSGRMWDGTDYIDEATAISQLRVQIDGGTDYVGVDLTVYPVEPTADMRAAERILDLVELTDGEQHCPTDEEAAKIIREETNIGGMVEHVQNLLAYLFKCRPVFARALFPVTAAGAPRDLTMDGLLLAVIEALEKTTNQKWDNLTSILKQPVSQISVVQAMPQKKSN